MISVLSQEPDWLQRSRWPQVVEATASRSTLVVANPALAAALQLAKPICHTNPPILPHDAAIPAPWYSGQRSSQSPFFVVCASSSRSPTRTFHRWTYTTSGTLCRVLNAAIASVVTTKDFFHSPHRGTPTFQKKHPVREHILNTRYEELFYPLPNTCIVVIHHHQERALNTVKLPSIRSQSGTVFVCLCVYAWETVGIVAYFHTSRKPNVTKYCPLIPRFLPLYLVHLCHCFCHFQICTVTSTNVVITLVIHQDTPGNTHRTCCRDDDQ